MSEPGGDVVQLLAAARAGSPEALGQVLETFRAYLLLVAGRELDPDLRAKGGASDLVQDTFLEAQRDFAQFQGTSEEELLAWLRQLLLHNVANFTRSFRATAKRKVGREVALETDDSANLGPELPAANLTPSREAVEREQAEALRRALERLPDDYRQVVVLRYLESRPFEEIGQCLN